MLDELSVWMNKIEREIEKLKVFEVPKGMDVKTYAPALVGFSANPNVLARYFMTGRICTVFIYMTTNGTSSGTTFTITAPFTAANIAGMIWGTTFWTGVDNSVTLAVPGRAFIQAASNIITLNKTIDPASVWTNGNGKRADFTLSFET